MAPSLLSGPNPILTRELRSNLRNARAFGLLALYVAVLGAIVTANFPGSLEIDLQSDGGKKGQELFWTLVWGQVALILAILPALSTGALAQERERQTLQPLLLTPLSPLQIVWGKAGGVLSLVGLLLLATLPLTSLCFLLGGVSPGMLVAAYAGILGLAIFTTGFGLYCSARWHSATKALLSCYALLPLALALVLVALPLGALFSGVFCAFLLVYGMLRGLKRGEDGALAKRMGRNYNLAAWVLVPLVLLGLVWLMWLDRSVGLAVIGIGFVLSYFVLATQWGLLQTARELMSRADPESSTRQKIEDWKEEWQQATTAPRETTSYGVSVPAASLPTSREGVATPTFGALSSTNDSSTKASEWSDVQTAAPKPIVDETIAIPKAVSKRDKKGATYGVTPFLSDKMNPIFARELRSGLLGKFEYLFRFGYGVTILSEVGLLALLLLGLWEPSLLTLDFSGAFQWWGRVHLAITMIFGAWFGARAIAPEREGQTLSQLFTIPLPARQIIGGKMMAVVTFTLYVWILAVPLALLMGMLDMIPWPMALHFLVAEAVLAVFAAAWGVATSFGSQSVRRALAVSLGGICALLLAHVIVLPIWELLRTLQMVKTNEGARVMAAFFPMPLLFPSNNDSLTTLVTGSQNVAQGVAPWALLLYALLSVGLFAMTARDFKRLARES